MKIAVTGNMGAGKSTFLTWLRKKLPAVGQVSMDALVDDLYLDPTFKRWLTETFGTAVKSEISERVARDPEAFRTLMSTSFATLSERLDSALASAQVTNPVVIAEIPLLFESGMGLDSADLIVTLDVAEDIRLARVLQRDARTEQAIRAKMAVQLSDFAKRSLADIVIDGTKKFDDQPAAQELVLAARVCQMFGKKTWALIKSAYTQPHRGYHGIGHLVHLFEEFEKVKAHIHHPVRFAAALLFHDYVYETNMAVYGQNESRSARAMLDWARTHYPALMKSAGPGQSTLLAGATELILATKAHNLNSPFIQSHPELKADAALFLDLDLSQLSRDDEATALADQTGIWREFSPYVLKSLFCEKRIEVLESLKARTPLYYTDLYAPRSSLALRNMSAMQAELRRWAESCQPTICINNEQGN